MPAGRVIRWMTAVAVIGVAAVAAIASYEHAYDLVRAW
jgi:Tfp pilus assembly protein PilE